MVANEDITGTEVGAHHQRRGDPQSAPDHHTSLVIAHTPDPRVLGDTGQDLHGNEHPIRVPLVASTRKRAAISVATIKHLLWGK